MFDQFQERLKAGVAFDPKRRPEAVQSLESWPGASDELHYTPTRHVKGALRACAGIRRLWVSGADEALIDEAAEVRGLEVLFVERPSAVSFASLGKSSSLRTLGIFNTQKVLTLESLATLTRLRTLSLRDLSRVHDLSPLGSLPDLEALAIDGPVERHWKVDSLAPLGSLVKLQSLFMASLLVSDGLLTPLVNLRSLRVLFCSRRFSTEQFRELMQALPGLECPWIEQIRKSGSLEAFDAARSSSRSDRTH